MSAEHETPNPEETAADTQTPSASGTGDAAVSATRTPSASGTGAPDPAFDADEILEAEAMVEGPPPPPTPEEDAQRYLALAQRTQADFDNFRKRAARDASAAGERGKARLAKELLPALDHLELALQAGERDPTAAEFAKGLRFVQDEIAKALGRAGIETYSPHGERFDPEQHEAMAQHAVEGAEAGIVVEVYQAGYRLNGSVLRPARVVVAA